MADHEDDVQAGKVDVAGGDDDATVHPTATRSPKRNAIADAVTARLNKQHSGTGNVDDGKQRTAHKNKVRKIINEISGAVTYEKAYDCLKVRVYACTYTCLKEAHPPTVHAPRTAGPHPSRQHPRPSYRDKVPLVSRFTAKDCTTTALARSCDRSANRGRLSQAVPRLSGRVVCPGIGAVERRQPGHAKAAVDTRHDRRTDGGV